MGINAARGPQRPNGGKREGAGRKPKATEDFLIGKLEAVISSDDVLKKLMAKVNDGDMQAIKLYMQYRFGIPKQTVAIETGKAIKVEFT